MVPARHSVLYIIELHVHTVYNIAVPTYVLPTITTPPPTYIYFIIFGTAYYSAVL